MVERPVGVTGHEGVPERVVLKVRIEVGRVDAEVIFELARRVKSLVNPSDHCKRHGCHPEPDRPVVRRTHAPEFDEAPAPRQRLVELATQHLDECERHLGIVDHWLFGLWLSSAEALNRVVLGLVQVGRCSETGGRK